MMESKTKEYCPEIPFWGARYPDAYCVDGKLYDLDKCDTDGNLYEPNDDVPCPFCRTEAFIELDYFGWVDFFCDELFGGQDYISELDEIVAKGKAKEAYLKWIAEMKETY